MPGSTRPTARVARRGLIRVGRADLMLRRIRRGRGYSYVDAEGARIDDPETVARLKALAVPPAWQEVWFAAEPRAHIQAVGRDAAGRIQYIYHPDWEERRSDRKRSHIAMLAGALPRIRRRVARDLVAPAGSRALALAIAVALIDRTAIRAGDERYLKTSGTRGASTLMRRDIRMSEGKVELSFAAKGGRKAHYVTRDSRLADAVARIRRLAGERLLVYRGEDGVLHPLTAGMINDYLKGIADSDITAKDFRTLRGSAIATEMMAELRPAKSKTARRRQMAAVCKRVSEALRNTPAISRASYIAPILFELFEAGRLDAAGTGRAGSGGLHRGEAQLAVVLEEADGGTLQSAGGRVIQGVN